MSRQLRVEFPGAILHVTARGNERRDIVLDDVDRRTFLDRLEETVDAFAWAVLQYTLMTNHYHAVIRLTGSDTLSRGLHFLNSAYAQAFNRRHGRSGHLFQGRPNVQLIERESYLLEVLRYVALNPVRANMVMRPETYEWSSHRAIAGMSEPPTWLAVSETLHCFAPDLEIARALYREFVDAGVGLNRNPWEHLVGQIYLGSKEWVERMRRHVDDVPRSDDHPLKQKRPVTPTMAEVIGAVSNALSISAEAIRHGRGGRERALAAWLARYEAQLDLRAIAAGLRLCSAGQISRMIRTCDSELERSADLQAVAARCKGFLRGGA